MPTSRKKVIHHRVAEAMHDRVDRAADPDVDLADRVAAMYDLEQRAAETLQTLVDEARAAGLSWRTLADALPISHQGAQQRWGRSRQRAQPDERQGTLPL